MDISLTQDAPGRDLPRPSAKVDDHRLPSRDLDLNFDSRPARRARQIQEEIQEDAGRAEGFEGKPAGRCYCAGGGTGTDPDSAGIDCKLREDGQRQLSHWSAHLAAGLLIGAV